MKLEELQEHWEKFGKDDPLWGILAWPDKSGRRWNLDEFFETGRQEIDEVLAYAESLGLAQRRGSALDFGCGVGRLSQALARHFQSVDGVDISPAMLELARKYNQFEDRCRYHLNPADDLSLFESGSFDFIYSNITLQHMHTRYSRRYLVEFLRLLTPTGVLIFQLPSSPKQRWRTLIQPLKSNPLFRLYQRLRYGDQPIMEMYGIEKSELLAFLAANGGRVVDVGADQSADVHWHSYRYCVARI